MVSPDFEHRPEELSLELNIMPSANPTSAPNGVNGAPAAGGLSANDNIRRFAAPSRPLSPLPAHTLFNNKTRCFVYGLQPRAVQGMLDFDFICKRSTPSVAGIIYTFGGQFVSKMYWGTSETLLPVYQEVSKAVAKHPDVDVVVNFASSRSVYSSTLELMEYPQIKTIAIIAEGVPERVWILLTQHSDAAADHCSLACARDCSCRQAEGHQHHRPCHRGRNQA